MLSRLETRFAPQHQGSVNWHGQTYENTRIDGYVEKFLTQKKHGASRAHRHFGRTTTESSGKVNPPFEYFHLAGDDELELATESLVKSYMQEKTAKTWDTHRAHIVAKYVRKLRELKQGEQDRLEAFQKPEFDDLHLTNAFSSYRRPGKKQNTKARARTSLPGRWTNI